MTTIGSDEGVERRSAERSAAERILIVAPTADDGELASGILREAGRDVVAVDDLAALAAEAERGAGVVVIASEALDDGEARAAFRRVLDRQEPWSEIPILVIGRDSDVEAAQVTALLGARAHVVLLERPLAVATFVTAAEAALRSRRRQYEVRRLIDQIADSAAAVQRAHDEASRAKDEFLATLAHELRSPMTAIRGWIQLLRMGDLDPVESADALAMIESSTKVQAHIIEDLMDISRILAGKIMIEPAAVELAPVVSTVISTFLPAAAQQGVQLTAMMPPDPVTVWADAARLQQIGWNLVSNAIKFTPRGGSVQVTVGCNEKTAWFRVRDTGKGISREFLPHVFERYRQADGESRQQPGVGLGLAIVKHLVESHGGTIEAFSEGLGKGADLVVTLPLFAGTRPA